MRDHPEKPILGPEDAIREPVYSPTIKRSRSTAKAISWRIPIGGIEIFTKLLLYFVHELARVRIRFGIELRS